jgi:hypothetical protein
MLNSDSDGTGPITESSRITFTGCKRPITTREITDIHRIVLTEMSECGIDIGKALRYSESRSTIW